MATHGTQEIESCFVVPSEKTPEKVLWLSPLDIVLANRGGLTPLVHFYRRDDAAAAAGGFFDVGRLKEALAKALVAFYPFAGRFRVGGDGRPEIDCNAEGVFFVVARSELAVDDVLTDLKPSPELKRLFIPRTEPPSAVLAVQVTFLRCGGLALGTAVHHAAVDGHSMFHFLQTWAAFCRDSDTAMVELPCHDRVLLRARSRLAIHPDAPSVFCPRLNLRQPSASGLISAKIFAISHDQLATLKQNCGDASTFGVVTALVWQCACVARRLPLCSQTRVRFPVNIRRRMRPPLPDRYFGNALVEVFAAAAVEDIVSGTLAAIAARIKGVIGRLNDDELLRSAIDYNEMAGMPDRSDNGSLPEAELRVVSWLGIPLYDVMDFGWGKPWAMSRAESLRGGFFYVMDGGPADGDGRGAAVRVLMCIEAANMEEFERLLRSKFVYARI
uniref:Uncharacterized protein n=1 Tax=Oryza punctata TaxID=4537 RepID=A0A0E0MD65_ORYPU